MKILKYAGVIIAGLAVLAAVLYNFRTDPIGIISGKRLSGQELDYPADWSIVNDTLLCSLETRVEDPHSVTTICFLRDGDLIIPSRDPRAKDWPGYVANDDRVRVKVGENIYPGRAILQTDVDTSAMIAAAIQKYAAMAERDPQDDPGEVWFYHIVSR